eukprot:TRINITY_DN2215_c0_g1_i2.p1 TRINITY_DN2215_c0_g1~~TRINITY_DN2215_c0_g1_i2.p1  ORF type:complete len:540 (+),score=56.42 TRINITY_DN2215_c0_g1_i2:50-1669(+)
MSSQRPSSLILCTLFVSLLALTLWTELAEAKNDAYQIEVSPTSFSQDGAPVTVTVHAKGPRKKDWIALYPAGVVDWSNTTYIKARRITKLPGGEDYLTTGTATLSVFLPNLRANLQVFYFQGEKSPTLVAMSPIITNEVIDFPQQPMLTLAEGNIYTLRWVSTSCDSSSVVRFGNSQKQLNRTLSVTCSTYSVQDMCEAPAATVGFYPPGSFSFAKFPTGLPLKPIYYQFGNRRLNLFSEVHSFHPSNVTADVQTFIAVGDVGYAPADGLRTIASHEPDAVLTYKQFELQNEISPVTALLRIGDLTYADGYLSQHDLHDLAFSPILSHVPTLPVIGNHELGTSSGGECGVPFVHRYPTVSFSQTNRTASYYSMDIGRVHFLVLDTENLYDVGTAQYQFVVDDLSKTFSREKTPWLVVAGHRPMYYYETLKNNLLQVYEDLFYSHGVDVALWGHQHLYLRTCPVYQQVCRPDGVTHIIVGTGGRKLQKTPASVPPPFAYHSGDYHGYLKVEATSERLSLSFLTSQNGTLIDSVHLSPRDP